MSISKSGSKSSKEQPKARAGGTSKSVRKPKGLHPYQAPAGDTKVAEPAIAYAVAPLGASIDHTLGLLSPFEQAEVLEVSTKTLTRWRSKGEALTPQQTDRVAVVEAIFRTGERVVGSREDMLRWIHSPIHYLEGQRPIELLKTETGRRRVEDALHAIEWGMLA